MALSGKDFAEHMKARAKDWADARHNADADYKAGLITREEWYRRNMFAPGYGVDEDAEGVAIREKLDREYADKHDRQQVASMKFDLDRGRGFSWRDPRLWDRCRKELEADGNVALLKAMDDAERDSWTDE